MTPSQWGQVQELFAQAVELEPAARSAFLDEGCPDAALRGEVESLLDNAGAQDDATIPRAVSGLAAEYFEPGDPDRLRIGQRMGPYRIEGIIGHGGMGAVYLAARDDDQFRQRVAIKLVRAAVASAAVLGRFRRERQILARLEHNYIARLTDGGITEDGLPFLAMEYVEGLPLTQYCEEHGLNVRGRIELFRRICEAVGYAHRNLIVHRDIKPGNILVTADGTPKLLDFGIAKLVAGDGGEGEETATYTDARAMTPDYASPEQAMGEPVTTLSDVYSLGAVLYELIAGARPHKITGTTPIDIVRAICETEVARPSTAAQAGARRELEGDLDNIVLKAMQKRPERRYSSVEQFSEDIRRYLEGLPVLARPDSFGYRAGKFARRNKWQIAAVAIVVVSLAAGLGFSIAAERRASRRFNQVRQLANRFLFDFHDEIANTPGTVKAREMIVSTALEYLNSLAGDAAGDPELQWELAVAWGKVAAVQGSTNRPSLRRPKDALDSYLKALALGRPLADKNALDQAQKELFVNLILDTEVQQRHLRHMAEAMALAREAISRAAGLPPLTQGRAFGELALALGHAGDIKGAAAALEQMLPVSRRNAAGDPSPQNRLRLATTLTNLATAQEAITRFEAAEVSALEAVSILRKLVAEQPGNANPIRFAFRALGTLGDIHGAGDRPSLERFALAARNYEEAIALIEPLIAADARDASTRTDLGLEHDRIAYCLRETDPSKAIPHTVEAAKLLDAGAHENTEFRAQARIAAGDAHRALGEFADAERLLDEADRILTVRGSDTDADLAVARARLEAARGRASAASGYFERAIGIDEKLLAGSGIPLNAWALTRVLDLAASAVPDGGRARRERILAVWQEQNRKYPGEPWIEKRVALAESKLRGEK